MSGNRFGRCSARMGITVALCLAVVGASPVFAQSESSTQKDQWQYAGAVYLWGADIGYSRWRAERIYLLVPAQAFVGNFLKTFKD